MSRTIIDAVKSVYPDAELTSQGSRDFQRYSIISRRSEKHALSSVCLTPEIAWADAAHKIATSKDRPNA